MDYFELIAIFLLPAILGAFAGVSLDFVSRILLFKSSLSKNKTGRSLMFGLLCGLVAILVLISANELSLSVAIGGAIGSIVVLVSGLLSGTVAGAVSGVLLAGFSAWYLCPSFGWIALTVLAALSGAVGAALHHLAPAFCQRPWFSAAIAAGLMVLHQVFLVLFSGENTDFSLVFIGAGPNVLAGACSAWVAMHLVLDRQRKQ